MKNTICKVLCFLLMTLLSGTTINAQTVGKPLGNTLNFFNTTSFGSQLGHRQAGAFGTFNDNARWISIGQPANVSTQVYGMRIQDQGYQATFSLNGNNNKNLDIQWGRPAGNTSNSFLNFNFATSNFTKQLVVRISPNGLLESFNIMRAYHRVNDFTEYTEMGHGGANAYINTRGDGTLDFRHDGANKMRLTDAGRLAINRNPSNFTLDVGGNARNTTGIWSTSDKRYKQGIKDMSAMTDKILQLEGVAYQFKKEKIGSVDLTKVDNKIHFGFIAQDLEKVFPELVMQDDEGYYAVRYEGLIPVLVEGFKDQNELITEQETTINSLNEKVSDLEKQLETLANAVEELQKGTAILTIDNNTASLGQNRPNPFKGTTVIDYKLPENTQAAELVIYSIDGKQVSNYTLSGQQGSLEFDASQLANGTYVYALLVKGEKIMQRKMVVK